MATFELQLQAFTQHFERLLKQRNNEIIDRLERITNWKRQNENYSPIIYSTPLKNHSKKEKPIAIQSDEFVSPVVQPSTRPSKSLDINVTSSCPNKEEKSLKDEGEIKSETESNAIKEDQSECDKITPHRGDLQIFGKTLNLQGKEFDSRSNHLQEGGNDMNLPKGRARTRVSVTKRKGRTRPRVPRTRRIYDPGKNSESKGGLTKSGCNNLGSWTETRGLEAQNGALFGSN